MALTTVAAVKLTLGVPATDVSQDEAIDLHVVAATAAVKKYTKRDLEQALYDEVYTTRGEEKVALRQRPVTQHLKSATLTQGSTSATSVAGATALVAGVPAVAQGYLPVGCTVASVSGTTVTLSAAATASGTVTVEFGVAAWLDVQAYGGQRQGAFADSTHLWPGSDFTLDLDGAAQGKSGLLVRLGGGTSPFTSVDWPYGWPGITGRRGRLTTRLAPAWPSGSPGCLRVVYLAGYAADAIPDDLELATRLVAVWLAKFASEGGMAVSSTSYEGFSVAYQALQGAPALATPRQLLSRFREVAI